MAADEEPAPVSKRAIVPTDLLLENVAAARLAVEAAETELARVINAIEVEPRVEKRVVSEAVSAALGTLRTARTKLEAATDILAAAIKEV
jgi:hypothetical protein